MKSNQKSISLSMEKLSDGDFGTSVVGNYMGEFSSLKSSINTTIENVSLYISDISAVLLELSKNNFDLEVQREYVSEFSIIKQSLLSIIDNINPVIHGISDAAGEVENGARQISENGAVLAAGTE